MKIDYLTIIKKSWKITWRNRYLWWFGFFISLSSIGNGNFYTSENSENESISTQQAIDFISQNIHWIALIAILTFIFILIFSIVRIISLGALISSIEKKIQNKPTNFKLGIKDGKENFWKILFISFFLSLFMLAISIILTAPIIILILNKNYIIGAILGVLALLILFPIMILITYIKKYSYLYAVLGKLTFWPTLENAYGLFQKNILSSLIMGGILILINILLFLALILFLIPITILFVAFGFLAFAFLGKFGIIFIATIASIIFIFIFFLLRSIYETFSQSVWILFFHEIAKPKVEETITEAETVLENKNIEKALPITEFEEK